MGPWSLAIDQHALHKSDAHWYMCTCEIHVIYIVSVRYNISNAGLTASKWNLSHEKQEKKLPVPRLYRNLGVIPG